MAFPPTPQQQAIIEAARVQQDLIIEAGAGTGKTSTLRLLADDRPTCKTLYIAYNKSVQLEATDSFPSNVRARTAHSLAYGGTVRRYGERVVNARMGSIPTRELVDRLGIRDFGFGPGSAAPLEAKTIAELTVRALTRFCGGDDPRITSAHVGRVHGLSPDQSATLGEHVVGLASRAWADYTSQRGRLTFTPSVYLKLWQLGRPTLRFDTIFFDECQDANGAMAAVVNRQETERRAVGDRNQALYEWNGAVDAMSKWDWHRLMLTKSFRFGPAIAEQANMWLDYLGAELRLTGHEPVDSRIVEEMPEPTAVLCRTNMGVIAAALHQLGNGRRVAVVGGIGEAAELARAAAALKSGCRPAHPDLAAFRTWDEFLFFVAHDPDGRDFQMLVNLIESYGVSMILSLQQQLCAKEADAEVTISTGHKAKGREWDRVLIGQDFAPRDSDDDSNEPLFSRPAAMLAYVAVTRARRELCLGPLAGVL